MNPTKKIPETFLHTLHTLSCKVFWLHCNDYTKEEIASIIKSSQIRKWIFTGSPASVYNPTSPKVSLELLNMPDKNFFFICYSMESILYQLGIPVLKRNVNKKELFQLELHRIPLNIFQGISKPGVFLRNHQYYTPSNLDSDIQSLASYENEEMVLVYKNSIMTQFHPEKTDDGKQIIFNWVFSNNLPWNNLYGISPNRNPDNA